MAQALAETIFDILYLTFVFVAGFLMLLKGPSSLLRKMSLMALILGFGDAFHLIPRLIALWTTGLESHAVILGIGKFITSITMTLFYLILYYVWRQHYGISGRRDLTSTIWLLTGLRIILCIMPQNLWLDVNQPVLYAIVRNIPFCLIGIIIIVLFVKEQLKCEDKTLRWIPLAVALSFIFYIPVVLFSGSFSPIGLLMIPKTLAYVWIIIIFFRLFKKECL